MGRRLAGNGITWGIKQAAVVFNVERFMSYRNGLWKRKLRLSSCLVAGAMFDDCCIQTLLPWTSALLSSRLKQLSIFGKSS